MNQRKSYPDRSKYLYYKTKVNGTFVLTNCYGDIILSSDVDDDEFNQDCQKLSHYKRDEFSVLQSEYFIHKWNNPSVYEKTYEEANFTHKALMRGFKANILKEKFYPYTNWFGVSAGAYTGMSPDEVLSKGNKRIFLSIQGMLTPNEASVLYPELSKQMALKYICFMEGDNEVYKTYTGEVPSEKIIEDFIND